MTRVDSTPFRRVLVAMVCLSLAALAISDETVSGATGTRTGTLVPFGAGRTVSHEIATTNAGTAGKTTSAVHDGSLRATGANFGAGPPVRRRGRRSVTTNTVTAGAVTHYVLTPATTRIIANVATRITIQPADANGNPTTGAAAVIIIGRNAADTADDPTAQVDADKNGTFTSAVVNTSAGAATFDVKNAVVESFRIRASDGTSTGVSGPITTYALATAGQVVISELAFRGVNGTDDEYINFYNSTDADILVGTTDGSEGWPLVAADGVTRFTIPNGTLLPARGSYLATNTTGFVLTSYPAGAGGATVGSGDIQYAVEIPRLPGAGVALFRSALTMDLANRLDAVGYTTADPLYREGAGLPAGDEPGSNLPQPFVRDLLTGVPKDTDDNAADFKLLDSSGLIVSPLGPRLGVPSPHSLASPLRRSQIVVTTIPAVPTPVRDNRPYAWNIPNQNPEIFPIGVLSVPKRFTNNTGQEVTRLRVRVVDLTTFPSGLGVSDLRVIDGTGTVTNSAGDTVVSGLEPMLVELPIMQLDGGGLNTTLTLDLSSLPGGVLANNAAVDVHMLLGVKQTGSFRFYIMMEALP